VTARTYASTANVGGKGFDQYPDTRSQVYRGYSAETPATNNAVASTAGQVVTYAGEPVVTYFFSTSGGYTENVENVFTSSAPQPWLKGVEDPYDGASPYHRWGPYTWSTSTLDRKLGSYVKGRFRGLRVLERGVSPRIVRAKVRGSRGDVRVTGPQLRNRLDLRDSWFSIRRVSTRTSSAHARISSGTRALTTISGKIDPIRTRFASLQRLEGGRWVTVQSLPLTVRRGVGSYRYHVGTPGRYRVLAAWAPGPTVTVP
jgi:stage II sporulation protein D